MEARIRPGRVALWLLAVVGALTLASLAAVGERLRTGAETVAGLNLVGMLHLDADGSVPEWFSVALLLAAAALAGTIAAVHRARGLGWWRHWVGIALILCYLSADEGARLHEQSAGLLEALFATERMVTRSWTVIAAGMGLVVAAVYARFWWRCEPALRRHLAAGAGVFVGGAVGMELVGHDVVRRSFGAETHGPWPYQGAVHVEEVMEMGAVVLVIYAFLCYLQVLGGDLRVRIGARDPVAASAGGTTSDDER